MARPSSYKQATADKICGQLAEGKSLRTICKAPRMPSTTTVFTWMRKHPEFLEQYTRAREEQAEYYADEIVGIADQAEDAQLARVQIDARKWVASKLKPKRYGDKVENTVVGADGGPVETRVVLVRPSD